MSKITYLTDVCLITCIVSSSTSQAEKMLLAARNAGAKGAYGYHARGYGARERFGALGVAVETEKDVVSLMVSTDQRDTVFEAMFNAGEMGAPGAGFMYVTELEKVASFIPDAIVAKLKEASKAAEAQ